MYNIKLFVHQNESDEVEVASFERTFIIASAYAFNPEFLASIPLLTLIRSSSLIFTPHYIYLPIIFSVSMPHFSVSFPSNLLLTLGKKKARRKYESLINIPAFFRNKNKSFNHINL